MATIVCALWLAAKRALFSFNGWALLARCSRHIQSVFNLIVDILMDFHVDWSIDSCQKGCPLTSVTWLYWGLKCTTHWGDVSFKVIHWPVIGFNWSQAQVHKEKAIWWIIYLPRPFSHYRQISDLGLDGLTSISLGQYIKALVWDFPLMTSLLVSKRYNYNDVLYCSLSGIPCAMS